MSTRKVYEMSRNRNTDFIHEKNGKQNFDSFFLKIMENGEKKVIFQQKILQKKINGKELTESNMIKQKK